MYFDGLKNNIREMKELARELYVFYNQYEQILRAEEQGVVIEREKKLLRDALISLSNQIRIVNSSLPPLINGISFYTKLPASPTEIKDKNLAQVMYKPSEDKVVSLIISDEDKKEFLRNLSISRLSINQLKKSYAPEAISYGFRRPSVYAKVSNYFFRNFSESLIQKGYGNNLNRSLRRMNSGFVLGTYFSMTFFTVLLSFFLSIFLFIFLLFFEISLVFPFFSFAEASIGMRFITYFWVPLLVPAIAGMLFYLYPFSESKNLGGRINQELPFVTIHMSAIASSGVNPVNIFEILVKSEEYPYTTVEFKKLLNLVNFHGEDIVTALREVSSSSPSQKLGDLLNGLAFTLKSGGDVHRFLNKHSENMLFDYKLERERYTRVAETFMDIYISVAIAAPMIFLMIFIIIGSTGIGGGFFSLGTNVLSMLLILFIVILNIVFLVVLNMKQPPM